MATSIGTSWTLLASHQIWTHSGRCNMYFQVYAYCSQNIRGNSSTVYTRARICIQNLNANYTGYSVTQTWKTGLTGAPDKSWTGKIADAGKGKTSEYILSDGSFTVNHDSSGKASSKIYYWFDGDYTGHIGTNGIDITLPDIDRTASNPTISNVGSTYNTAYCDISVPFVSTANQWSKDGTNWTDWNKSITANTAFKDTWTGLSPNTNYTLYYRFRRDYNYVWSNPVSFNVKTKLPDIPKKGSLNVSSITYKSAILSWSDFSIASGASDFYYQISSDGSSWNSQDKNVSVSLNDLSPGAKYTYYVRIVDNFGQVSQSASVTFTTLNPDKPNVGIVRYINLNAFGATFNWSGFSISEGATSYYYQYSLDREHWTNVGTKTGVVINDLIPETSYVFYVRVVDNFGTASEYAGVSFKTLADQVKVAYNSKNYEDVICTLDGKEILCLDGKKIDVDLLGLERLRQAKLFYNDKGTIKKVKKLYFNSNGKFKIHINFGE